MIELTTPQTVALVYLVVINLATAIAFIHDKRKAEQGQWRTKESTLLGLAAIGGATGAIAGMRIAHHKTLKPKFTLGVPLLFAENAAVILLLFRSGIL